MISEVMQKITVRGIFNQQKHGFLHSATANHANNVLVRPHRLHQLNFVKKFLPYTFIWHI